MVCHFVLILLECIFAYLITFVICLQIPEGVADDDAVRIFVEFKKMDSAIKGDLSSIYLMFWKL